MKKTLLFLTCLLGSLGAYAQADGDYYLDIMQTQDDRFPLKWDSANSCYTVTVPELWGDFKIYSKEYEPGGNDQDHYIYGAADGHNGVSVGSEKNLSNPGTNLCVEGGGIIYNAEIQFRPGSPATLSLVSGSTTKPEPTGPALKVSITKAEGTAPTLGNVEYDITTTNIDNPESVTYDTRIYYSTADGEKHLVSTATGTLTGLTWQLTDLTPGTAVDFYVLAYTTYNGETVYDVAKSTLTTPALPILIGQIEGGEWNPENGVHYTPDDSTAEILTYHPKLTGDGEFSFVTRLDPSWDVVNQSVRYAPDSHRVEAPNQTWMPVSTFNGSTENAWKPEKFNSEYEYSVYFDFPNKRIMVNGLVPTGIESVDTSAEARLVNVYSIDGVLRARNVERGNATDNLAPGVYIVDGKKVLVRR